MDYSIIVPAGRKDKWIKVVDSIVSNAIEPYTYEIIIVSPYPKPDELDLHIVWIEETNPQGGNTAFNLGAHHSKGDYVITCMDDWGFNSDWCSLKGAMGENQLGGRNDTFHTVCMTRKMLTSDLMKGNVYNPVYLHSACDNDLTNKIRELGYPVSNIVQFQYSASEVDELDVQRRSTASELDTTIYLLLWPNCCPAEYKPILDQHPLLSLAKERIAKFSIW